MKTKPVRRINVNFPEALLLELKRSIPARERNRFIVEATEKELKRARLLAVLDDLRRQPAWKAADHPDLGSVEDVDRYVRQVREAWGPYSWEERSDTQDGQDA